MDRGAAPAVLAKSPKFHLKHVEGMRALAALVVFTNHSYAQTWNPMARKFPEGALAPLSTFLVLGHLSVTVFIVISGFCLALPVVSSGGEIRGGARGFFKRRAKRILPPYYGAVALCLILIATVIGESTGTLWDIPILVTPFAIFAHAVLIQDLFATSAINYVFWSIAVEWQIYFLFPLLVGAWNRFGPRVVVPVALALGYAVRFGFEETRVARAHPHYLGMFVLGMLAAYVASSQDASYARLRKHVGWKVLLAGALVATAGLIAHYGVDLATKRFHVLDLPVGLVAMSLLVLASRSEDSPLTRAFSWRPLVWIGTFSYSLYLVHAPLLQIIWQYVLNPLGFSPNAMFVTLMTAGFVAIVAASYLFFRIFEAPFMRSASQASRRAEAAPRVA